MLSKHCIYALFYLKEIKCMVTSLLFVNSITLSICVYFHHSKRPAPNNNTMTSPPTKRKVSPIRFSSSTPTTTGNTRKSAGGTVTKRQARSVYEPPKGSYSDKLDTSGIADNSWQGGRGRGRRNRRGRGSSWRTGRKWTY